MKCLRRKFLILKLLCFDKTWLRMCWSCKGCRLSVNSLERTWVPPCYLKAHWKDHKKEESKQHHAGSTDQTGWGCRFLLLCPQPDDLSGRGTDGDDDDDDCRKIAICNILLVSHLEKILLHRVAAGYVFSTLVDLSLPGSREEPRRGYGPRKQKKKKNTE